MRVPTHPCSRRNLCMFSLLSASNPALLSALFAGCLLLFFTLGLMAAPLIISMTQAAFLGNKKMFYNKFAQQQARGLWWLLLAFMVLILPVWGFPLVVPELRASSALLPRLLMAGGTALGFLCLNAGHALPWMRWKALRPLHTLYGMVLGCIQFVGLPLLVGGTVALWVVLARTWPETVTVSASLEALPGFLSTGKAMLTLFLSTPLPWLLFTYVLFMGLCIAGASSLLWLLMRRNRDDYGRDYYVFAMRYGAWWAVICAVAAALSHTALCVVLHGILAALQPGLVLPMPALIAGMGTLGAATALWLAAARSPTPLRHKPGVILAWALLLLALCLHVYSLAGIGFAPGSSAL